MSKRSEPKAPPIFSRFIDEASEPLTPEILDKALLNMKNKIGTTMYMISTPTTTFKGLEALLKDCKKQEMLKNPNKYPMAKVLYSDKS